MARFEIFGNGLFEALNFPAIVDNVAGHQTDLTQETFLVALNWPVQLDELTVLLPDSGADRKILDSFGIVHQFWVEIDPSLRLVENCFDFKRHFRLVDDG